MKANKTLPWGYQWRSSTTFILIAIVLALFTDVFLYSFIVPILPYMLEDRLKFDKSKTQSITFTLLSESALVGLIISPFVGHVADRISDKKSLLLYSLGGAMVGTVGLAVSESALALFASRFVQAFASNAIFVLGLATIAENIPSERICQTMGIVTSAVSVGTSAGTMLAGVLLELFGYWPTWSTAFALIAVDAISRLLMIEKEKGEQRHSRRSDPERSPLLTGVSPGRHHPSSSSSNESYSGTSSSGIHTLSSNSSINKDNQDFKEKSGLSFYAFLLRQRRCVGGVTCYIVYSMIISSFDTTLPLHVREAFKWDSGPSGLMFLALQGPGILLGPLAGTLKDHIGTRCPAVIAFFIIGPSIWLMGLPEDERFPWFNNGERGQILYVICMILIGCMKPLLNSIGTLELTLAIEEIQHKWPGIFGLHGGNSRAMSISNMSWIFGIFMGAIVSGSINEKFGYFETNSVLAGLCVLSGINALLTLGPHEDSTLET